MTTRSIKEIISYEKDRTQIIVNSQRKNHRTYVDIDKIDFYNLLRYKFMQEQSRRNENDIAFNDIANQKPLIEQLYLYFTGNKKFNGDLQKGIYIYGNVGCGKSILLKSFIDCFQPFGQKIYYKNAINLGLEINNSESLNRYTKQQLMIDDLGRETDSNNDYSASIRPINNLFFTRYEIGMLTFVTCQISLDDNRMKKKYGEAAISRMKKMMNQIHLPGGSLRK